ncbi:hypothetical protein TEA_024652 [Camellia sinensis var. sinensis]|uniref:Uncharacterized protein n=1 Tax=Camellia sinensis var. sinensis TaxID=542762 RepID=A0A4S4CY43_CAMSN|nr:hypothetical protein TEA_024652 [Camellia sinensis var. sinensis]
MPRLLGFLDHHFATTLQNNQSSSSSSAFSLSLSYKYNTACDLEANLSRECAELAAHPQHLHQNLAKLIISWISRSIAAKSTLHKLNLTTMSPYEIQKMMSEDLPQLAMELSRVENIRSYARSRQEKFFQAVRSMNCIEDLLTRREKRQLGLLGKKKLNTGLWAIDELVSPIASRSEYHFSKWVDQPEFIFALVSKITKDFIGGVDDVLQPLIDRAKLVSLSAKEAWISTRREERQLGLLGKKKLNTGLWAIDELVSPIASRAKLVSLSAKEAWISVMVQTLSSFLAKRVLSVLVKRYKEKKEKSEMISSWLHLIDLMVNFDRQMMSLVNSEAFLFTEDSEMLEGLSRGLSVFSLFSDRPDCLKIWAKIELKVGRMKLKEELKHERAWLVDTKNEIGSAVDTTTERLLLQYKEIEFLSTDCNDDSLLKLCAVINAARYYDMNDNSHFFGEEIKSLADLETNLLMEIIGDRLGQFEPLTKEYVQSKECFKQEEDDDGLHRASEVTDFSVSVDILEALDTLRSQLCIINASLNPKDFRICGEASQMGLTDSFLAAYSLVIIDSLRRAPVSLELICEHCSLFFSYVVFQPFSTNPEAFFPLVRNSLKLLEMDRRDLGRLNFCGVTHLSFDQADKILRNRKF